MFQRENLPTHGRRPSSASARSPSLSKPPIRLLHDCHITMPFRAKLSYPSQQLRIICNDGGMAPLDLASNRRNRVEPGDELARMIYLVADGKSAVMTQETAGMFALEKFIP
jgi:hypothetical protein